MNPQTTSILATLFVVLGAIAVALMLEMTGRLGDQADKKGLIRAHKFFGYLFLGLLAVMLIVMTRKVAGLQEEMSSRTVIHIVLALLLVPLAITKLLLARRYPRHGAKLPLLGLVIFMLAFALTGISAGYYALHRTNLSYTTLSALDADVLDLELGKTLTQKKCSKCHSLERVYRAFKSQEGWAATVNTMARIDAPNITRFHVKQVLNYLIEQQKTRRKKTDAAPEVEIGKTLVAQKCSICHPLDRIFGAEKNSREWTATINRMITTMDDPDFLTKEEQAAILTFLSQKGQGEKK